MSMQDTGIRIHVVCKVTEESVLLGQESYCRFKLTERTFVLFERCSALLCQVVKYLVFLMDSSQFSLSLLKLLIHISDTTTLIICASLVQIKYPFFLPILL